MVPVAGVPDTGVMDEQTAVMDPLPDAAPPGSGAELPPPTPGPEPGPGPQPGRLPWYQVPLWRDRDQNRLGGVIAGVSAAYGFDRRATRIGYFLAAFVVPALVLLYLVAWALLPDDPAEAESLESIVKDRSRLPLYIALGIVLVAGGLGSFGSWFLFGGFPWGVALIALGVLLWVVPTWRRNSTPVAPPPPGTAAWTAAGGPVTVDPTGAVAPVRRRRRRWPIGSLTLLAVIVGATIGQVGENLDWWELNTRGAIVLGTLVVVAGLVVSVIVNRAWLLVPLALVTAAGLLVFTSIDANLDGPTGERTIRPTAVTDLVGRSNQGIGELTVDLRDLELGDGSTPVRAEVGFGRLHVIVPDDVRVEVRGRVGAGELRVDRRTIADGWRLDERVVIAGPGVADDDTRVLVLDLQIGGGQIDVDRSDVTVVSVIGGRVPPSVDELTPPTRSDS
jgi:phage shock protein PspC (stress-responsive transcriptional regulator)